MRDDRLTMTWQQTAHRKQEAQAAAIEATLQRSLPGKVNNALMCEVGHDVASLVSGLSSREITAESVTLAAIHNAINAHKETNCLSETLFDSAIKRARDLDEHLRSTGTTVGPLHGVPISLKDQFDIAGVDTTLGYIGRSSKPAKQNAALVTILNRLGAVIITKTDIPQSILWGETESPLWGLTTYPGKAHLTPGGSSGGEAAILAMSGSLVGWGTDIGGSIRGPAHMCGLFGLKPTSSRFPYSGVPVSHEGQSHVSSSVGPMARQLSTLITVTKECLSAEPWNLDPDVTPLPWREEIYESVQDRPLRIGVIYDDGVVRPHPEIEAAVRLAAELLENAGHEIVPWDTTEHQDCIDIMDQFYRADGGEDIEREVGLAGEPMIPHVAALVDSARPISVYEYWQLNRRKTQAQQAYQEKWTGTRSQDVHMTSYPDTNQPMGCVDVIISPVLPHTAVPHRSCRWTGYTKIWNFLDYTAMSFPLGKMSLNAPKKMQFPYVHAGSTREHYMHEYAPRNAFDEWNQKLYNPELMDGLPIGVQIIGQRYAEEKVLGVASVLERLLETDCRRRKR